MQKGNDTLTERVKQACVEEMNPEVLRSGKKSGSGGGNRIQR